MVNTCKDSDRKTVLGINTISFLKSNKTKPRVMPRAQEKVKNLSPCPHEHHSVVEMTYVSIAFYLCVTLN